MLWTWATLNSNDRKIMELESKIKFFFYKGFTCGLDFVCSGVLVQGLSVLDFLKSKFFRGSSGTLAPWLAV